MDAAPESRLHSSRLYMWPGQPRFAVHIPPPSIVFTEALLRNVAILFAQNVPESDPSSCLVLLHFLREQRRIELSLFELGDTDEVRNLQAKAEKGVAEFFQPLVAAYDEHKDSAFYLELRYNSEDELAKGDVVIISGEVNVGAEEFVALCRANQ
jgi:hypothetical protein